ncbi:hypothetical protein [uncultured Microbulbifer sp.]|uniref:hypothetical protein n=1 Tax=uncultured Microbulbifer sp. TaxID=348147 RepID=UPI002633C6AB|nr:hypothetical protein [uncultured Microbulbifer sp.]
MHHKLTLAGIALCALSFAGCNGIQFNTNAGPYVSDRIGASIVREYTISEISQYNATTLGFVEASYCQEKINERKASKSALVRDLKVRTQKMGGNGLVVEACGTAAYGACQTYMECRGVAYSVPERKGDDIPDTAVNTHF